MTQPTNPVPADRRGLIPHLVCDGCAEAIDFYKRAFGAEEMSRLTAPGSDKIMHAAIRIGESVLFLNDDFPEYCEGKAMSPKALGGTPVTLHRYVEDCDEAIRRAEQAGATVKMPPADMFWGDRYGVVVDPFGHNWSIATHISDPTPEQMRDEMQKMFAQS